MSRMNRRSFLAAGLGAGAAGLSSCVTWGAPGKPAPSAAGEALVEARFPRQDNLNTVMARAWLCLRNNPLLRIPEKPGQYWGALSEERGDRPVGNGRAVWVMYGVSFQHALFHLLSRETDDAEPARLLDLSREYLRDSPARIREPRDLAGAFWSQENILSRFPEGRRPARFTDQAFRRRVWTHAAGWMASMFARVLALEPRAPCGAYFEAALSWLLRTQRPDGSWPHSWIPGIPSRPSRGFCGDAWWAVLALLRALDLGLWDRPAGVAEAARKALEFLHEKVVGKGRFFGSFEDVGGPADGYSPFHAVQVLLEAFRVLGEERYRTWARKAWKRALPWIHHAPSPWLVGESERIPRPSSSNMAMMAQGAASFLRFGEEAGPARAAAGLAHISRRQRRDPADRYFGGIDWYDGATNFSGGWFQAQLLLRGRLSLLERACRFVGIDLDTYGRGEAFGEKVEKILFAWPGLESQAPVVRFTASPEVDYLVLLTRSKGYALLMNDGGLPGSVQMRLDLPKKKGTRLSAREKLSGRLLEDRAFLPVGRKALLEWDRPPKRRAGG